MLVKLVVCDNREFDDQFGVCCGAHVFDVLEESFVGDDKLPKPVPAQDYDSVESVVAEQQAFARWEERHFPRVNDKVDGVEREMSRPYLAVLVIGTTGWSGWSEAKGQYWACTFNDLNEEGQALYNQVQKLYPGCDLHLLTFLDT